MPDSFQTDPVRLRQVIVNLVGNAIKFTSEGEVVVEVSVESATPKSTRLHFVVSDTGIGISDQDLGSIFEPFEQADGSTTRAFEGTGLGLAITKRLVEMMRGRVWAESTVGEGSEFHFVVELPNHQPETKPAAPRDVDFSKLHVVVVDDNATNRRILKETLEGWKTKVRTAANGREAIAAVREVVQTGVTTPLLVSDVQMPEMDGFQVAEQIRSCDELAGTEIILLTSGGRPGDVARCEQLGIRVHLMKPVKPAELRRDHPRRWPRSGKIRRSRTGEGRTEHDPCVARVAGRRRNDEPDARQGVTQGLGAHVHRR